MYTETLENKRRKGAGALLMVVAFVFGVILLVTAFGAWGAAIGSPVPTYAAYLLAAALAYLLIKRMLTDYRYTLTDEVVVFERVVGTRARILDHVELTDAVAFAPLADAPGVTAQPLRATFLRDGEAWALDYTRRGKTLRVVFHPTDKLAAKLQQRLGEIAEADEAEPSEPAQTSKTNE